MSLLKLREIVLNKRLLSTLSKLVKSEVKALSGSTNSNVGIITLCDQHKLNALTVEMGKQFMEVVQEMKKKAVSQEIRACIVTGEGDAFSAGGDLKWLRERHDTSPYLNNLIMIDFYNSFLCAREIGVPTIAAINGPAIGAGLCMTLACDIRIALATAKLGFTFPKLGIHPGMGASILLPRIINQTMATHLLLSGNIINGIKAAEIGLILESAPSKEKLIDYAMDLATSYASNSPIAVQGAMHTLRLSKFRDLDEGLQREADSQSQCYPSQDFLQGLEAVKNKTIADFKGW